MTKPALKPGDCDACAGRTPVEVECSACWFARAFPDLAGWVQRSAEHRDHAGERGL